MKLWHDFGVRALFGVIVLTPAMYVLGRLALDHHEAAITTLTNLAVAVIAFYFGTKARGNDVSQ